MTPRKAWSPRFTESTICSMLVPVWKIWFTPAVEHGLDVFLGNDAAHVHNHVGPAHLAALVQQARHEHEVRIAHHRAGDDVGVLVPGRDRQGSRGLPQPRIDDVDPAVAESPRDELDAPVVAIKAHFAQQNTGPVGQVAAAINFHD